MSRMDRFSVVGNFESDPHDPDAAVDRRMWRNRHRTGTKRG
jgi:hypothetical protein